MGDALTVLSADSVDDQDTVSVIERGAGEMLIVGDTVVVQLALPSNENVHDELCVVLSVPVAELLMVSELELVGNNEMVSLVLWVFVADHESGCEIVVVIEIVLDSDTVSDSLMVLAAESVEDDDKVSDMERRPGDSVSVGLCDTVHDTVPD